MYIHIYIYIDLSPFVYTLLGFSPSDLSGYFHNSNIQVDSAKRHGILLKVIQVFTDLNLIVTKAYICFDAGWFMDGK